MTARFKTIERAIGQVVIRGQQQARDGYGTTLIDLGAEATAELAAARELAEAAEGMLPSFNPSYSPAVAVRAALAKCGGKQ